MKKLLAPTVLGFMIASGYAAESVSISSQSQTLNSQNNLVSGSRVDTKLKGALIHSPNEIHDIQHYSNSYGFLYYPGDLIRFEQENHYSMNTVAVVSGFLRNKETGVFSDHIEPLIDEIRQSGKSPESIIVMFDEPFWLTRLECQDHGKAEACHEVVTNFTATMSNLESAAHKLKSAFPGIRISHNMAYAEIVIQVRAMGRVWMMGNADLYSFDCYGAFDACGDLNYGYYPQTWYGTHVYNEMMRFESASSTGRKLLMIPGAYEAPGFPNQYAILGQLVEYEKVHQYDFVAGSALFYKRGYDSMGMVKEYLNSNFRYW